MTVSVEESRTEPAADAMTDPPAMSGHDGRPRCGGQKHQGEGPCRQPAGWGTEHVGIGKCKLHGGCTPNHVASAAAKATTAEAKAMLERLGEPEPLGDPIEELLGVGAEAKSWLGVLRELVSELHQLSKDDVALIDRVRAPVQLYGEAMDRAERVLVNLAKLGLDERRVRITEAQALHLLEMVATALSHPDLALTAEMQRKARAILAGLALGHGSGSPTSIGKLQVIEAKSHAVSPTSAENGAPEAVR